MALGQSMLCLRATSMLSFPGVCFLHPAALTGSPLENTIKAPLSVTNLIQDKPANPFADYKPMAGGSLCQAFMLSWKWPRRTSPLGFSRDTCD